MLAVRAGELDFKFSAWSGNCIPTAEGRDGNLWDLLTAILATDFSDTPFLKKIKQRIRETT